MKGIVFGLVGCALGIWLAYTIQFEWKFFGATMMRFQDIAQVWAGCVLVPTFFGAYLGFSLK